jgi:NAD(P)H-flavin reductase
VSKKIAALKKAGRVGLRGPFGTGWPLDEARGRDVIVVAGGLGLAPLRPAIYRLLAERKSYGRVALLVGARAPEELVFAKELERWRKRLQMDVTVDRAGPEWQGPVGVVTTLVEKVAVDAANAVALVCGPEVMMRFAARALDQRGLRPSQIHVSLERNMKCAVGFCGHCQLGPEFVCRDGPVFRYDRVASALATKER